jgi:hypothetical protein
VDDVRLNQHGRPSSFPDVEGARDGAIDLHDLPGTCRSSLYEVRSQLGLGRLRHHNRSASHQLKPDLALEGAPGRDEGQCYQREQQSTSTPTHAGA